MESLALQIDFAERVKPMIELVKGRAAPAELVLKTRRTVLDAQRAKAALLHMKFRDIGFVGLALRLESTRPVMTKAIESPATLIGNEGIWWPSK